MALSFKLKPSTGRTDLKIDFVGVLLSVLAVVLVTYGVNALTQWGVLYARPAAPYSLYGFSPALVLVAAGLSSWALLSWPGPGNASRAGETR